MKLFVCGDIVNRTPGLSFVDNSLADIIKSSDYSVCNFEGAEIQNGQKADCPHQEPGTAEYLRGIGFDLMLLANNHITELGPESLQYSINTIKRTGADCIGAGFSWKETYRPLVVNINNKSFGIINVCEAQEGQFITTDQPYGYAWLGYEGLYKDIKDLAAKTDYVIVFVHAGLEHYSIPLPEIREMYKKMCDAGAKIVIGGHTHSAQGYEHYNNNLIVYSLGNFYFPYSDNRWKKESFSYSVNIEIDEFDKISVTPIFHNIINNMVKLSKKDQQIDIDNLNKLLDEGYSSMADEMCVHAYKNLCSRLLAQATCGEYDGMPLKQLIKKNINCILLRKKVVAKTQLFRDSLILRLFENETYRWTIIRALKNKLRQESK